MKSILIMGVLWVAAASGSRAGGADDDLNHGVEVQVAGLRVVGDGYGEGAGRILPLNWRSGTTISLMVNGGGGAVLDLDAKASRLLMFEDDQGTDLLPDPDSARPAFGLFPQRSEDRKAALIEIWGDGRAAADARELRIKGVLALRMGGVKTTERTGAITPRAGAAATLGSRKVAVLAGLPFPDEVEDEGEGSKEEGGKDVENQDQDQDEKKGDEATLEGTGKVVEVKDGALDEQMLSLRFDGDPEGIGNVRILDKDGKALKVEMLEVRVVRRGEVRAIYRMELPVGFEGEIMVEADVWDDPKTVQVPFDAEVSVGLR